MKSSLTFDTVTYERQKYGIKVPGRLTDAEVRDYPLMWEMRYGGGGIAIASTLKSWEDWEVVTVCEDGCEHCPTRIQWWTLITWDVFIDVPPEHQRVVRHFGETLRVVVCPVLHPISLIFE